MSNKLTREEEQQTVIQDSASIRKRLTPRQAIREHCIDCVGGASSVRDCQGDKLFDSPCIFFHCRLGTGRPSVKLIQKFCLYCMGGSWKVVPEHGLSVLALPHGEKSDYGEQKSSIRFRKKASPWVSFRSGIDERGIFDTKIRADVPKHKKGQKMSVKGAKVTTALSPHNQGNVPRPLRAVVESHIQFARDDCCDPLAGGDPATARRRCGL